MTISPNKAPNKISIKAARDLLVPIILKHPQHKIIFQNKILADVSLKDQLQFLSDYFGGNGEVEKVAGHRFPSIGTRMAEWLRDGLHPRPEDLIAAVNFWRQVDRKMVLSSAHSHPRLVPIIEYHPQHIAICGKVKPENLPLRAQLQFLSDYFGGAGEVEKALGHQMERSHYLNLYLKLSKIQMAAYGRIKKLKKKLKP